MIEASHSEIKYRSYIVAFMLVIMIAATLTILAAWLWKEATVTPSQIAEYNWRSGAKRAKSRASLVQKLFQAIIMMAQKDIEDGR